MITEAISAIAKASMFARPVASIFELPTDRKCIAFVNENMMSAERFSKIKLPAEVTVVPINVPEGQTIDDVVRVYELPH